MKTRHLKQTQTPTPTRTEAAKPPTPPPAPAPARPAISAPAAARPEPPRAARVTFELVKPEAKTVFVAGSFNGWKPEKTPLARAGSGRWTGNLSLAPGRHEYLFVVDGEWVPDPNARDSVANPFGGRNSVLVAAA